MGRSWRLAAPLLCLLVACLAASAAGRKPPPGAHGGENGKPRFGYPPKPNPDVLRGFKAGKVPVLDPDHPEYGKSEHEFVHKDETGYTTHFRYKSKMRQTTLMLDHDPVVVRYTCELSELDKESPKTSTLEVVVRAGSPWRRFLHKNTTVVGKGNDDCELPGHLVSAVHGGGQFIMQALSVVPEEDAADPYGVEEGSTVTLKVVMGEAHFSQLFERAEVQMYRGRGTLAEMDAAVCAAAKEGDGGSCFAAEANNMETPEPRVVPSPQPEETPGHAREEEAPPRHHDSFPKHVKAFGLSPWEPQFAHLGAGGQPVVKPVSVMLPTGGDGEAEVVEAEPAGGTAEEQPPWAQGSEGVEGGGDGPTRGLLAHENDQYAPRLTCDQVVSGKLKDKDMKYRSYNAWNGQRFNIVLETVKIKDDMDSGTPEPFVSTRACYEERNDLQTRCELNLRGTNFKEDRTYNVGYIVGSVMCGTFMRITWGEDDGGLNLSGDDQFIDLYVDAGNDFVAEPVKIYKNSKIEFSLRCDGCYYAGRCDVDWFGAKKRLADLELPLDRAIGKSADCTEKPCDVQERCQKAGYTAMCSRSDLVQITTRYDYDSAASADLECGKDFVVGDRWDGGVAECQLKCGTATKNDGLKNFKCKDNFKNETTPYDRYRWKFEKIREGDTLRLEQIKVNGFVWSTRGSSLADVSFNAKQGSSGDTTNLGLDNGLQWIDTKFGENEKSVVDATLGEPFRITSYQFDAMNMNGQPLTWTFFGYRKGRWEFIHRVKNSIIRATDAHTSYPIQNILNNPPTLFRETYENALCCGKPQKVDSLSDYVKQVKADALRGGEGNYHIVKPEGFSLWNYDPETMDAATVLDMYDYQYNNSGLEITVTLTCASCYLAMQNVDAYISFVTDEVDGYETFKAVGVTDMVVNFDLGLTFLGTYNYLAEGVIIPEMPMLPGVLYYGGSVGGVELSIGMKFGINWQYTFDFSATISIVTGMQVRAPTTFGVYYTKNCGYKTISDSEFFTLGHSPDVAEAEMTITAEYQMIPYVKAGIWFGSEEGAGTSTYVETSIFAYINAELSFVYMDRSGEEFPENFLDPILDFKRDFGIGTKCTKPHDTRIGLSFGIYAPEFLIYIRAAIGWSTDSGGFRGFLWEQTIGPWTLDFMEMGPFFIISGCMNIFNVEKCENVDGCEVDGGDSSAASASVAPVLVTVLLILVAVAAVTAFTRRMKQRRAAALEREAQLMQQQPGKPLAQLAAPTDGPPSDGVQPVVAVQQPPLQPAPPMNEVNRAIELEHVRLQHSNPMAAEEDEFADAADDEDFSDAQSVASKR